MINNESNQIPIDFSFDIAMVAVGYEKRCRYIAENFPLEAAHKIGLEFGFLQEGSYETNRKFFLERDWKIISTKGTESFQFLVDILHKQISSRRPLRVFVDISSMSREMMAAIILAIDEVRTKVEIQIVSAYAPALFSSHYDPAPIRVAEPLQASLAGWSSNPEKPLGVVMGLGCEPNLALGALQVLEPNKAWAFSPRGIDPRFDAALDKSNEHIADIFDITKFQYDINNPSLTRGRIEALLNSIDENFRLITIPFGPKIFSWLIFMTIIFGDKRNIGIWSFSSKDHAIVVDRDVHGEVIWHNLVLGSKLAE